MYASLSTICGETRLPTTLKATLKPVTSVFVWLLPRLLAVNRYYSAKSASTRKYQRTRPNTVGLSNIAIETIEITYLRFNRIAESRLWCENTDRCRNGPLQMSVYAVPTIRGDGAGIKCMRRLHFCLSTLLI